jgi:hypothetical protein
VEGGGGGGGDISPNHALDINLIVQLDSLVPGAWIGKQIHRASCAYVTRTITS